MNTNVEFTGKAIRFEQVKLRMGSESTKLFIVDEANNYEVLVGMYSSRERAEEVAQAIGWYAGTREDIAEWSGAPSPGQ